MGKALGGLMESHKSRSPIMGGKGGDKSEGGGTTVVQGGGDSGMGDMMNYMAQQQAMQQQAQNASMAANAAAAQGPRMMGEDDTGKPSLSGAEDINPMQDSGLAATLQALRGY